MFSRVWKVTRLLLESFACYLDLRNVTFLVADTELACDDLFIGIKVLLHICIDSRTFLERKKSMLDGTVCNNIEHPSVLEFRGCLGRLMITLFERVQGEDPMKNMERSSSMPHHTGCPRSNYFLNNLYTDPFPDENLMKLEKCSTNMKI